MCVKPYLCHFVCESVGEDDGQPFNSARNVHVTGENMQTKVLILTKFVDSSISNITNYNNMLERDANVLVYLFVCVCIC